MVKLTRNGKEKIRKKLYRVGLRLNRLVKQKLTENGTVSSGVLRNSYEVNVSGDFRVSVGSPLKYARYVEFGTGPRDKYPPKQAIKDWVKRELNPENLESATWAVMTKIKEEGTDAQPHLRPAIDQLRNELRSGKTF